MSDNYLELELAAHAEPLADENDPDYHKVQVALGSPHVLYHQLATYKAKAASIVVNSYNTGTGKTKAALLRLLDLNADYEQSGLQRRNSVLFIAPTNELLRQHEQDIQQFVDDNSLKHRVLRLDANEIRQFRDNNPAVGARQAKTLHNLLDDPGLLLRQMNDELADSRSPYVLVTNPDIFYYRLYSTGNNLDQRQLFNDFTGKFGYIVVDELHYYNAKQLANFLFYFALLKHWRLLGSERHACLLTATPNEKVKGFLDRLNGDGVSVEYIEPDAAPSDLPTTPTLAPIHLRLYAAEQLANGLIEVAEQEQPAVDARLRADEHGAIISSALWRINQLFDRYNGSNRAPTLARLTGVEVSAARKLASKAALIFATPTVDIGYNFSRAGKQRQSLDFLFFDASTSDEFIQRLGRAGRVLGKPVKDVPSDVYAVVPEKLLLALRDKAGQPLTRSELKSIVDAALPPRNGLYEYIRSGAITEAFLPIFTYQKAQAADERQWAEAMFEAVRVAFGSQPKPTFKQLEGYIKKYKWLAENEDKLLTAWGSGKINHALLTSDLLEQHPDQGETIVQQVAELDEQGVQRYSNRMQKQHERNPKDYALEQLERFYTANARFNFRDDFQPPQVVVYDPERRLGSGEYALYSALHVAQNFVAAWSDDKELIDDLTLRLGRRVDAEVLLACTIQNLRPSAARLNLYFKLAAGALNRKAWEERYCRKLTATCGFELASKDGSVPAELNTAFRRKFFSFYAVPTGQPDEWALRNLSKRTSLYTHELQVKFSDQSGEQTYILVLGSAALLVSCERSIIGAGYAAQKAESQHQAIFDWGDCQ